MILGSRETHRVARILLALFCVSTILLIAGCSSGGSTVIIRDPEPEGPPGLTARERGELRREALQVARSGWEAFAANDTEAMASSFTTSMVEPYIEKYAGYSAEGRERHREYEIVFMDVTKMSTDGGEVTVTINAADTSYFIEPDGSRTETADPARAVQMTLVRVEDGTYLITRMLAANAFLD
jgi:hypothetical protein